jgi:elongation factor G
MPDPLLPLAIEAHSKADEDKLSQGLARLVAEDPTMRLEQNQATHQVVLWCLGEAHADVALERLRSRYGVQVDVVPHKVSLRETFSTGSAGRGRHVKQSGGHGQYAICEIDVEPLPPGSGIEFVDKVVGGAVPRQFIPSVEKGVRAQAARGVAAGYPLVDVRITLRDGKAHSVDSSDAAFQTAGALALREAAADARINLLEPVAELQVLVSDEYVGPVMSDLSGRRGRVVGTEQTAGSRTLVRAEVPELEIGRYAVDLRSISHGTGRFSRRYARHEAMPQQVADRLREQATANA